MFLFFLLYYNNNFTKYCVLTEMKFNNISAFERECFKTIFTYTCYKQGASDVYFVNITNYTVCENVSYQ